MATAGARDFPLAPLQRRSWLTLLVIAIATVAIPLFLPHRGAGQALPWLSTSLAVAVLMALVLLALRRRRIAIEGRDLAVAATFYTLRIGIDALDLAKARIVDLAEHTEFAPMVKSNGYGLPGFGAGRFLLRNRMRAFCLLTRRERVLVLPRRDGKAILLSPEQPRQLLDALNALAAPAPRR